MCAAVFRLNFPATLCRRSLEGALVRRLSSATTIARGLPPNGDPTETLEGHYRRELPKACIRFSSNEGKDLFRKALEEGHMEGYFKLSEQFTTQDDPAYCGLTSLTCVLNALDIDPKKIWKGPWRWFHESMLNCHTPLDAVQERGITLDELATVAQCHGAGVTVRKASKTSVHDFRKTVEHVVTGKHGNAHLVVSFDRGKLDQTGTGHFSPVGGYCAEKDMILILDVARFKYPPHWVSLPTMFEAMRSVDSTTKKSRGYMVVQRSERKGLLFDVCRQTLERWPEFGSWWRSSAASICEYCSKPHHDRGSHAEFIEDLVRGLPDKGLDVVAARRDGEFTWNCDKKKDTTKLLHALERSTVFKAVAEIRDGRLIPTPSIDGRHTVSALILACAQQAALDALPNNKELYDNMRCTFGLETTEMAPVQCADIDYLNKELEFLAKVMENAGKGVIYHATNPTEDVCHSESTTCPVDYHVDSSHTESLIHTSSSTSTENTTKRKSRKASACSQHYHHARENHERRSITDLTDIAQTVPMINTSRTKASVCSQHYHHAREHKHEHTSESMETAARGSHIAHIMYLS